MSKIKFPVLVVILVFATWSVSGAAAAQDQHAGHGNDASAGGVSQSEGMGQSCSQNMGGMHEKMGGMNGMGRSGGMGKKAESGSESGTVFTTIQALVKRLQADPNTDWSQINIAALHQHLVDMKLLSLHAQSTKTEIPNGVEYTVSGDGRTLEAIQRMVPMHARQIQSELGWQVSSSLLGNGARFRVETSSASDTAVVRALGFMGFMTLGDHHDSHHLAIAGAAQSGEGEQGAAMDHGANGGGGHQH